MPLLSNRSSLAAALVPAIDHTGRNTMVVLAKGTWAVTAEGRCEPVSEQPPLSFEDTIGDPPARAMRLASDLCEGKPGTDVLFIAPSDPRSLAGRVFGASVSDLKFAKKVGSVWPFGPLERNAPERLQHAGTYDERWRRQRMPVLPEDFDIRYHHDAPEDQRLSGYLRGDEMFRVAGWLDIGSVSFALPGKAVLVTGNIRKDYFSALSHLDTVMLWSERPWVTLVWRWVIRPRQKIEEIGTVVVHLIRTQTAAELYGLA